MMAHDPWSDARAQQALASDPDVSVFVSASAGSGKTKLLIDRLLRLMLPRRPPGAASDDPLVPGSDPARIQCLTFTKAAAAEMQVRLQHRLGAWVTLPEALLAAELASLGVATGPSTLHAARGLFARVLDLPGGMRISTIHAFCQSLLRRFPLEASISPHFQLAEETDQRLALGAATDAVLARLPPGDPSLALLAGQVNVESFTRLVEQLRARLHAPNEPMNAALLLLDPQERRQALLRAAGVSHADEVACIEGAAAGVDEALLAAALRVALARGSKAAQAVAQTRLDWLAGDHATRARTWTVWRDLLLTASGEPRANGGFAKARWLEEAPDVASALLGEAARIQQVEDACRIVRMASLSAALLGLALPILQRHASEKRQSSLLDYDDLIARTLALLDDPGVAWVLFKLDGGLDHLLLDEVQDTSPLQWQIAWALTGEFFAGQGAAEASPLPRTIFAVGDYKQSIYAFQGADPAQFHLWRERFRGRVEAGGGIWREPTLTVSFRSVAPVLDLVDAVFAAPEAARGLIEPGQGPLPSHRPARVNQPGRVELWPLTPLADEAPQPGPWQAPRRNAGQESAPQRLAEALARWIAGEIGAASPQGAAPLSAGDVLVLVPRRSAFVRSLIRALKSEDVPVATLVRTGLVEQLAVQDLLALCDALLLPDDDLTVGCVLTSPFGGLSDDSLMELATSRGDASLWDSLRARHGSRADWQAAWRFLSELFARVDYAAPYALLGEALGRLGGRARLLARLGPEAAEPVDELLSAALRYEDNHPPSLQGFLHWVRHSEETIKREPDSAGDAVRVMTVHGAKGLQARLVVIPDTTGAPRMDDTLLWTRDPETKAALPFWVPRAELACTPTHTLSAVLRDALLEEQNRLLYVALTRASDRLLICGWQTQRPAAGAWYELCRQGFERAGAVRAPFTLEQGGWPGERLLLEAGVVASSSTARVLAAPPPLPDWLGRAPHWRATPPRAEPSLPDPLAPSRPDDVAFGPRPALLSPLHRAAAGRIAGGREAGLSRGRLVHALLQHLPELPASLRASAAHAWLSRPAQGLTAAAAAELAGQALAVLDHPELAGLFGPGSRAEQPLAGLAGGVVVTGQVDRVLIDPEHVLLCDFKTGREAPATPAQVPVLYLRQMAAYRALLEALYPDRPLRCLLIWTEGPSVMRLPDSLLDRHRPGMRPAATPRLPA